MLTRMALSFAEIETRLRDLGHQVDTFLYEQERSLFSELLDVGEHGVALEMLADWLAEEPSPITATFRTEAVALAESMAMSDRVSRVLHVCPTEPEQPGRT